MAGEELSTILSSLIEPAFEKVTCSPFIVRRAVLDEPKVLGLTNRFIPR